MNDPFSLCYNYLGDNMASAIIHLCVAKKIGEKLNILNNDLLLGSIAPDIAKVIGENKNTTHFIDVVEDIPNVNYFIKKYGQYLNNNFELGYFIHLYTDKLWYEQFDRLFLNDTIRLKDGTILVVGANKVREIIYNDYGNVNIDLIDKYSLNLKLFYEDIILTKTYIDEYSIEKTQLLLDKMGIIIANSKNGPTYSLDLTEIEEFIETTTDTIINVINNLQK